MKYTGHTWCPKCGGVHWMYGGCTQRLERGEGSGGPSCSVAAKRAEEQDGPEDREQRDRPQSLAVPPVEAEANELRRLVNCWEAMARQMDQDAGEANCKGYLFKAARCIAMAEAVRMCAADLLVRLPKPESEQSVDAGDSKQSQESPEACADPDNGTASGRRNE